MASFYWDLLGRTWQAFVGAFGNTTLGFVVPVIVIPVVGLVLVFLVTLIREGRAGVKTHLGKTFTLAAIVAICGEALVYGSIFGYWLLRTVYQYHQELASAATAIRLTDKQSSDTINATYEGQLKQLQGELSSAKSELDSRKHMLHVGDPAFHNMTDTVRAFMTWRRNIGYNAPCRILVTTPDKEDGGLFMTFITFAVFGSNCPNGDLNNVGVRPENVEAETNKGMIPGVIVFHAPPDAKGANQLETELSNLFQVKRAYTIPGDAPENTVWLQFGTGVEWSSQKWSRIRK